MRRVSVVGNSGSGVIDGNYTAGRDLVRAHLRFVRLRSPAAVREFLKG